MSVVSGKLQLAAVPELVSIYCYGFMNLCTPHHSLALVLSPVSIQTQSQNLLTTYAVFEGKVKVNVDLYSASS